ncbi:MAG: peptidoglycan DD-metalloendopeptidase family protein [candidate division Zixibacteria bacterium]|nr:peptidoglycan DD-metalloendopeptidase family protein [candidate division Zixibacteria bacterium]
MTKPLTIIAIAILFIILIDVNISSADEKTAIGLENAISNRKGELESIQSELKQKQQRLSTLENEEKDYIGNLYAIEEQLNLNNRLLTKTKNQIKDLNRLIEELKTKLENNESELTYQEKVLVERLVWIYKRSRVSPLLNALSAGSPLMSARRLYMFSLLNGYDKKIISDIEELNQQIITEKAAIVERIESIKKLNREQKIQNRQIQLNRKKRKHLLKEVRAQKNVELTAIEQLNKDQDRISAIIDILSEHKTALDKESAKTFLRLKGKLVWPVRGKIIRRFGKITDKKYYTVILNPGIDIKASAGVPVYAASSGEAVYISWLRGYGSFIILGHGGGYYTLYAHLDDILVEIGQFIAAGEIIAAVGETGSFSDSILHFELRFGKEQLDPLPWLR